jgi:xanthine dehydrogenase YagS FAD-binding subunit
MRDFAHQNARSIKQAVSLLAKEKGRAKLNAGGTDLLGLLKDRVISDYPKLIINIKNIGGLDYIREDVEGLRIGALARLTDMVESPLLNKDYRALAEAARSIASPQIRNMATLGGNLCQDVRCWYYRYPHQIGETMQCLRKGSGPCLAVRGDNRYHAIINGKKCYAVCPSDMATALAALDGHISVTGPKGVRDIAVTDFYNPLGNAIGKDEMVTEITVPTISGRTKQSFLKFTLRKSVDFAIVSVASAITVENNVCTDARIVLGAVAPAPFRVNAAEEKLLGRPITEESATEAAEAAVSGAHPLSKNAYKIQITKALVKKAIMGNSHDGCHTGS